MTEVSASIAETNRIRQSMGLPPLATTSNDQDRDNAASTAAAAAMDAAEAEAESERRSVESIRAELARRKEARAAAAKLNAASLGESLRASSVSGSARDWIERSRQIGMSEAERAKKQIQQQEAAEKAAIHDDAYTQRDLSGLKVAHDYAEFDSGDARILTLKDQRLLMGVADGLNEEEDELVNAELEAKEKQEEINARRKGVKSTAYRNARYDVYGEEESELLAKYSEAKEKAGMRLAEGGSLEATEARKQAAASSALAAQDEARKAMNQLVYSLDDDGESSERKMQTDFKTVSFRKKKKKKGSNNGATNGAADGSAAAAASSSTDAAASSAVAPAPSSASFKKSYSTRRMKQPTVLADLSFLAEPTEAERMAELSSRSRGGISAVKAREQAEQRRKEEEKDVRYLRALKRAEEMTRQRNELDERQASEAKENETAAATSGVPPPPPSTAPPPSAFLNTPTASASASVTIPPPPPPVTPAASSTSTLAPPPGLNLFEEEEDELLAESLARARRLELKRKEERRAARRAAKESTANGDAAMEESGDEEEKAEDKVKTEETSAALFDPARAVAEQIKQSQIRVKTEPGIEPEPESTPASSTTSAGLRLSAPPGMSVKSESGGGGLVLTSTTEFVRGLQFDRTEQRTTASAATVRSGIKSETATPMEVDGAASAAAARSVTVVEGSMLSDDDEDMRRCEDEESEAEDEDEDDHALTDEPYAATGVAAALQLFKSRGILKEHGGRSERKDPEVKDFNLDQIDSFGRVMSKKEQFRALSHKFHGIMPGLKKTESRLRRVQEDAARMAAMRETGGVNTLLMEQQRRTGSAHVTMDKTLTSAMRLLATPQGAAAAAAAVKKETDGDGATEHGGGKKRKKHAGPFAQFGYGKGHYKKRNAAQQGNAQQQ